MNIVKFQNPCSQEHQYEIVPRSEIYEVPVLPASPDRARLEELNELEAAVAADAPV